SGARRLSAARARSMYACTARHPAVLRAHTRHRAPGPALRSPACFRSSDTLEGPSAPPDLPNGGGAGAASPPYTPTPTNCQVATNLVLSTNTKFPLDSFAASGVYFGKFDKDIKPKHMMTRANNSLLLSLLLVALIIITGL